MKRIVSIILIMCFTVPLFGCSQKTNSDMPKEYEEIIKYSTYLVNRISNGEYEGDEDGQLWGVVNGTLAVGADIMRSNIGYQLTDINGDNVEELVLAYECAGDSGEPDNPVDRAGYSILSVYTLDGDKAVLLAEKSRRVNWYINSDGLFVSTSSSVPAYFDVSAYSLADNATKLDEVCSVYNEYLEDTQEVGVYKSVNGGESYMLNCSDDPIENDIFSYYTETVDEYTGEMYELNLTPLFAE